MAERKRSNLWLHFSVSEQENKARCDICKSLLSYKGGTTSNLRKHLLKKHPTITLKDESNRCIPVTEIPNEAVESSSAPISISTSPTMEPTEAEPKRRKTQASLTSFVTRPISISRQKKMDLLVLRMVVKDLQPFSVVEDEGFRELCAGFDSSYKLPSRTTLSRDYLPRFYEDVRNNVKLELSKAEFITLTTDTWTSRATESYMSVTAHFVDSNWSMNSILLDCFKMEERHTAQNLRDEIIRVVNEWDIYRKVHTVVTDNAANIVAAIRLTGWYHWSCAAHSLNLVVQNSIFVISDIHKKVKNIVEYFHRSTAATEKLISFQKRADSSMTSLKLINDVVTRWNSTYEMFQRFERLQEHVEAALGVLHNPVQSLSEEEWETLREVSALLKPFQQLSVELSSEQTVSISKVIVLLQGLRHYLEVTSASFKIDSVKNMFDTLIKGLGNRFPRPEYNNILSRPTFLDPRFKSKAFQNDDALLAVKENVTRAVSSIMRENDNQPEIPKPSGSPQPGESDILWSQFEKKVLTSKGTPLSTGLIEVRQFNEEQILHRKEDPLKWWKTRELVYPGLAKQAKRHLGVVATSVPSERVFSLAGDIISEKRSRLTSENAKMLIFLNSNKKYFK